MPIFTMPEVYRDDVPVNGVLTTLPAFPIPHYAWPCDIAQWRDLIQYGLIKWGQRKNVRVTHNLEYGDIGIMVEEFNLDFAGTQAQSLPQDIVPSIRLNLGVPDKLPHEITQGEWDTLFQSVTDRYDKYWSALGTSNADDQLMPSAVQLNCIESTGAGAWYTTWRNTRSEMDGLSDAEKRTWDCALNYAYVEMARITNEKFPGVPTMIYTNRSKSYDYSIGQGRGPLIRMPDTGADAWTDRSFNNYAYANVEFWRRSAIIQLQGIDRQYTGEQQDFPSVLPADSEFAQPISPWINAGPDRGFELQYRAWVHPNGDPFGSVAEALSYPWYESWLLNHSWVGTQYREDNWRFWPQDRITRINFWPRMWQVTNSDWWLMARLCGANNIESDLILSDYDGYTP